MSIHSTIVDALIDAALNNDLAQAALLIARIEYPGLDPAPYLARLDALGEGARKRIQRWVDETGDYSPAARLAGLNAYLFEEQGFVGNRAQYEDPRNSYLNEVLDRRTGIPITLSLVYMEVARRAGMRMEGVNFPGHFLVRFADGAPGGAVLDPFHRGAVLSKHDCRRMLEHNGEADVAFDVDVMATATPTQIVVRMLLNLKRIYVHMRSFPQARDVTELLLAVSPSALSELRDRGLLAFHLNDLSGALRDLQTYLRLSSMSEPGENADDDARKEREQLWEHVKTLRRRVAALN
jgi:regulator of sirC expression with transglutaminase-like and TPR domain